MPCHKQEHDDKQMAIRYSNDELLSLKDTHCTNDLDTSSLILPSPLRIRKIGRKGGVRARTRRRGNKLQIGFVGANTRTHLQIKRQCF